MPRRPAAIALPLARRSPRRRPGQRRPDARPGRAEVPQHERRSTSRSATTTATESTRAPRCTASAESTRRCISIATDARLAARCRRGLGSPHDRPAIHPPPPALRLFAARRRDPGQGARRPLRRRRACPRWRSTDTGNLFAALEFSETMAKAGIQPIMGCQLALAYAEPAHPGDRAPAPRPDRPARPGRDRLRQPDEAHLAQLPRLRRRAAARHAGAARRPRRRADLPHRRRRGPARRR